MQLTFVDSNFKTRTLHMVKHPEPKGNKISNSFFFLIHNLSKKTKFNAFERKIDCYIFLKEI